MQADTSPRRPALLDRLVRLVRGPRSVAAPRPASRTEPSQKPVARARPEAPPILYAAADPGGPCPIAGWLRQAGYRVIPAEGFGLAIGELMANRRAFGMLVIDVDGFGGADLVVARLADLRKRHPSLPVIVISAEVRFNDFTTERMAICDVTLRAPVSAPALELALAEAAVNNLLWQARQIRSRTQRPAAS